MTTSNYLTIQKMLILLLSIHLQALTQSQAPSQQPNLSPQYTAFLKDCQRHLTVKCSNLIIDHIFANRTLPTSCCSRLISTGPACHRALVETENIFIGEHEPNREEKTITVKGDFLWETCTKRVPPPRNKNYPRAPPKRYWPRYYDPSVEKCEEGITKRCGTQVADAIFKEGKKVDDGCCKKLLKLGRKCHETLVNGLMNLGKYEKEDKKEVKAKTGRVWKKCEDTVKGMIIN